MTRRRSGRADAGGGTARAAGKYDVGRLANDEAIAPSIALEQLPQAASSCAGSCEPLT